MVTTSCCWIVGGRVHGYSSIKCDMSDKHRDRGSSWITIAPSKVSRIGYIFMIKSKCALFCSFQSECLGFKRENALGKVKFLDFQ